MKIRLSVIGIMLLWAGMAGGQTLKGVASLSDYWPEGEKRVYQFYINDNYIGRLEAVHSGGDESGRVVEEELDIDASALGLGSRTRIINRLTVQPGGFFLKTELSMFAEGKEQHLTITYDSTERKAKAVRDGSMANYYANIATPSYAADHDMVDQLELILARFDLMPGRNFVVPVFSPQGMYGTIYEFRVTGKTAVRYGHFADSVWEVQMLRPAQSILYVNADHRLVRMENRDQKLVAEWQRDPFASATEVGQTSHWFTNQVRRLPVYGLSLLFAFIWLPLIGRGAFRLSWAYILFAVGGLFYPLIYITQVPLQQYYGLQVITPVLQRGESVYLPAIVPALLGGVIQQTLKLIPILLLSMIYKTRGHIYISLAAFLGAGFGFIEACHILGPTYQSGLLSGLYLAERFFGLTFHVATAALIGYGIGRHKIWSLWALAVLAHTVAGYLVVFVQHEIITVKSLEIFLALYNFGLLALAFFLQRAFKKRFSSSGKQNL